MILPSDEAIRARAEQQGLLAPGAELTHDVRKRVAAELHREATAPRTPDPIALLSRFTYPVPGGTIRVDVTFIPADPTKEPTNG